MKIEFTKDDFKRLVKKELKTLMPNVQFKVWEKFGDIIAETIEKNEEVEDATDGI
jgi:hypothetical protein